MDKMERAKTILVLDNPFFGLLAMKLLLIKSSHGKYGWTDGIHLGYNPQTTNELPVGQVLWLWAHEVLHVALEHHLRMGSRELGLWNQACDYVVNLILRDAGFEQPSDTLYDTRFRDMTAEQVYDILWNERQQKQTKQNQTQQGGQDNDEGKSEEGREGNDESSGQGTDGSEGKGQRKDQKGKRSAGKKDREDSETVPEETGEDQEDGEGVGDGQSGSKKKKGSDKKAQPEGKSKAEQSEQEAETLSGPEAYGGIVPFKGEDGDGEGRSDSVPASSAPTPNEIEQHRHEWRQALAQAAQAGSMAGNLPGSLKELVKKVLEPRVDWATQMAWYLERTLPQDYDWMRPDPNYSQRDLFIPSLYSEGIEGIYFLLDTSISTAQWGEQFAGEVSGVLKMYQAEITVIQFDTVVQKVERLTTQDLPFDFQIYGRGGTDFQPPFLWLEREKEQPKLVVVLTDLECSSYPKAPDYPVLWIRTPDGRGSAPPFGDVVIMN